MEYRAEATTLEGFIQQLAVAYVARGYRYFFQGRIPDGKDPRAVDAKLIARYGVAIRSIPEEEVPLGDLSLPYARR